MLIISGDLYLTDGTSGETMRSGSSELSEKAFGNWPMMPLGSATTDYVPIDGIDLILLQDVLEH